MKIEIRSAEVKSREVPGGATGKPFTVRSQAAIMRGAIEVKVFDLNLGDQQSYAPGLYEISSESFTVDSYGRVGLSRNLKLEPVQAAK